MTVESSPIRHSGPGWQFLVRYESPSALLDETSITAVLAAALAEDLGDGDISTTWTAPHSSQGHAVLVAKSSGCVAGVTIASRVFQLIDPATELIWACEDGTQVEPTAAVAELGGSTAALLSGERVFVNLVQRISGIATETQRLCDAVKHTGTRILDTRKTAPGLRLLDKYAVRVGGGLSHRTGLYDMVLLKENHIAAVGSIAAALARAQQRRSEAGRISTPIGVEVSDNKQLGYALEAGADWILLDNMSVEAAGAAMESVLASAGSENRPVIEVSGNVDSRNVVTYAESGVDVISIGALTHSAPAMDFSMRLSS